MHILLAISSEKPTHVLDALHSANLKLIASRLIDSARGASVDADHFKLVN
jgi:hypothetical protein